MHIFKVMFPDNVQLNEKNLINTYKDVSDKLDPEKFIETMFFCRTAFDRYVIKTVADNNSEDGERWTLRKPRKKEDKWYYVDTFSNNDEDNISDKQNRIIKALSMLQVTYRTRIYKNWLFDILKWLYEQFKINVEYENYLHLLDHIILDNYEEKAIKKEKIDENTYLTRENSYSEGLKTPHFLLNFIDYLYWVDSSKQSRLIASSSQVKSFDFKYWNSIEHHMAREWASRNSISDYENFIDNLGNLCLISKSANSRLSDRDAREKAEVYNKGNLGAKRQIMYAITKENNNYREEQIKKHYNELLVLLSKRKEILGYKD